MLSLSPELCCKQSPRCCKDNPARELLLVARSLGQTQGISFPPHLATPRITILEEVVAPSGPLGWWRRPGGGASLNRAPAAALHMLQLPGGRRWHRFVLAGCWQHTGLWLVHRSPSSILSFLRY